MLNLVGGFHALGTLMSVGLMILPAAAARFWATELSGLLVAAVVAAVGGSTIGLLLSYHANVPSGPAIILTCGGLYLASMLFGPQGGIVTRMLPRRHLEA